ncbi:MAG: alpha/beta hydrolase [Gammaproteobacteria bacterium]|nr:alpha/beta hydrolase [Gammaproteobacteria bacterium]
MNQTSANGTSFECHGPVDAPVIALIHGLGLTRGTWEGHIPLLSQRYRIVNYDLYGHGESAPPPVKPSLSVYAQQLHELLQELGINAAAVVGFSLGGMINRRFAIDYPAQTLALGIFNSPHERSPEAQALAEKHAAQSSSGGPGAVLDAAIKRWFTAEFIQRDPQFIDRVRNWVLANDPEQYALCRMVLAAGVTELIRPVPPVTAPSLVITCEHDSGSTPAMTEAIASEISGAKSLIVPGLKHMGLTEQPRRFTEPLLQFLESVIGPGT